MTAIQSAQISAPAYVSRPSAPTGMYRPAWSTMSPSNRHNPNPRSRPLAHRSPPWKPSHPHCPNVHHRRRKTHPYPPRPSHWPAWPRHLDGPREIHPARPHPHHKSQPVHPPPDRSAQSANQSRPRPPLQQRASFRHAFRQAQFFTHFGRAHDGTAHRFDNRNRA